MKPAHLIILLLMNLCWAGVYSAYKVMGPELASGGIVTLRFGLAGVFMLLAWPWYPGAAPRGRDLVNTCIMGCLVFVLGQRLQVYGNQIGTAGNSAVLVGVDPLIASLGAALFLGERIGPRRLAGFALGMCGVALLNGVWRQDFQWTGLVPSLIFVSSFVSDSACSVMGKPIIARADAMKMLTLSLLAATAVNLLIDGPATLTAAKASASSANRGMPYLVSMVQFFSICVSRFFTTCVICPSSMCAIRSPNSKTRESCVTTITARSGATAAVLSSPITV